MTHFSSSPAHRRGFTLVEVMVAMVIGMLGIIIMMQVFATTEGRKRTTTGTGDAQSNGAMAIHELQRDIRHGGYGINSTSLLNCSLALGAPSDATLPVFAPVIINPQKADGSLLLPAGDANTDTLLIAFGNSGGSPEGDAITLVSGNELAVHTPANFAVGDRVVAAPGSAVAGCAVKLTTVTAVAAPRVTVASASGAAATGLLFNLGATPTVRAYAIRGGNLAVCNYMANDCGKASDAGNTAVWTPIANGIVGLRAQYGRDTSIPMNGSVDIWDQTTPASACNWLGASALRLAVVARNSQFDKGEITTIAPVWEGSADTPFDLSAKDNWKNYRYKVFETVVPVRNLPWMAKCS